MTGGDKLLRAALAGVMLLALVLLAETVISKRRASDRAKAEAVRSAADGLAAENAALERANSALEAEADALERENASLEADLAEALIRTSGERTMKLRDAISRLYGELERIAAEHEELTDTDVREALHETLNYYFVWGKTGSQPPCCYYMFSRTGDEAVAAAVNHFLAVAVRLADAAGLECGQPRLDALQDASIRTPQGERFDLFIGYAEKPLQPTPLHESRYTPRAGDDD